MEGLLCGHVVVGGLHRASVKARLEMIRNLEAWTEDTEACLDTC